MQASSSQPSVDFRYFTAACIVNIACDPDGSITTQCARNLTMDGVGFLHRLGIKTVVMDRDPVFTREFRNLLEEAGCRPFRITAYCPWENAFAERWVRSVKTEMLRKVVIIGESGLRHVMEEYVRHFNSERTHQGIKNTIPAGNISTQKVEEGGRQSAVLCRTRLGGVLKHYYRAA